MSWRRLASHDCPHIRSRAHQLADDRAYERFKGNERTHRVAREHDHRDSVIADQSKALRLARLHGDLGEVARTHLRHHSFDNVEVALTDSARGQDQIGTQQLITDQLLERVAIITDLSDSEDLGACGFDGGRQQ